MARRYASPSRFCFAAGAGLLAALCLGGAPARAQAAALDLSNLDVSSLLSDPTQLISLLPQLGLSEACQTDVITMGANCLPELQLLPQLLQDPKVTGLIAQYSGVNVTAGESPDDLAAAASSANLTGMPVLSDDEIQSIIDEVLPIAQGLFPDGKISDACCSQLSPVVSDNCLCSKTTMDLVYSFTSSSDPPITDLNPYLKFVDEVMGKVSARRARSGRARGTDGAARAARLRRPQGPRRVPEPGLPGQAPPLLVSAGGGGGGRETWIAAIDAAPAEPSCTTFLCCGALLLFLPPPALEVAQENCSRP